MKYQLLNKFEKTLWQKENNFHYEKFIFLTQCFQKSSAAEASESVNTL